MLSVCAAQNAYASSVGYGVRFDSSMRDAAHAVSSSVSDTFKNHPYLVGALVLGTATLAYRAVMSKNSVSPELTFFNEERVIQLYENGVKELEEDLERHTEAAKIIERIRVVMGIIKNQHIFDQGCYRASLIKNKQTKKNSVLLKGNDPQGNRYPLWESTDEEGHLFCQQLNEYLDPSTKSAGERTLRVIIGLSDKQPLNEVVLKSLLGEIRSTLTAWE